MLLEVSLHCRLHGTVHFFAGFQNRTVTYRGSIMVAKQNMHLVRILNLIADDLKQKSPRQAPAIIIFRAAMDDFLKNDMSRRIVFQVSFFLDAFKVASMTMQITGHYHLACFWQVDNVTFSKATGAIEFGSLTT